MPKKVLLCSCAGTQPLQSEMLSRATGLECSRVHSGLCAAESPEASRAMAGACEGELLVACGQETARLTEIAEEAGAPAPDFVDLRDRAGWSDEAAEAGPKMAALLADAALAAPSASAVDVVSAGLCLIAGPAEAACDAADRLCGALSVTVLITDGGEPPIDRRFDVVAGRLRRVQGALGGFTVTIDALREVDPTGRGALRFGPPRDGGRSDCDIVLDLTGGPAAVPAPDKREGYLRADPRDPGGLATALIEAVQLVGTFEKPLYVRLEDSLCAHSRAQKTGCTRCLDICPTSAITPAGDHVAIDPMICAGCGACSAVCPSGAITYDDPPPAHLFRRMETLARTYRAAGAVRPPRLLVTDRAHGREMIALAARFGRGLPADVLPMDLATIAGFGHAEMLAALASGFAAVDVLLAPTTEREALDRELTLAEAIAGAGRLRLLDLADPEALPDALYGHAVPAPVAEPVLPMGARRQVARLAAKALNPGAETPLPLPDGAPYGAVLVDPEACTLCLSCVSLCPSGALLDNEDLPQLRFQEDACLQCGICANICPENAITLAPQFDLTDAAMSQRVLNEEEPFACVECGALFGVKSTVERISAKLAGKHSMFGTADAARMIQMCDDCRVNAQFHARNSPLAGGERPRVRTSDDYFSERKDH